RRRYLDDLRVAQAPGYGGVGADYGRVLRRRTALLKSLRGRPWARQLTGTRRSAAAPPRGSPDDAFPGDQAGHGSPGGSAASTLDVWDEHLATAGAGLLAARVGLTRPLPPLGARAYAPGSGGAAGSSVAHRQSFSSNLHGQLGGGLADSRPEPVPDAEKLAAGLREALALARAEEIDRGVCLAGPHRDEVELRIGDLPARGYASQGESWSAALALRLGAFELLRQGGDDPVLLLDDVFPDPHSAPRDPLP